MAKNYSELAQSIMEQVGGASNVAHFEHCSTRLRFTLSDPDKANREKLKQIKGVMGVIGSGVQCQVVIGNDVIEVYDEIMKNYQFGDAKAPTQKGSIGSMVLDFLVGVFQPLVPAIAGAGILKAFLSLFVLLGWMDNTSSVYTILYQAADAALYFLPVMVGVTMATKLNVNRLVAVAITGTMILPAVTAALAEGIVLFGFQIQNITYAYQVFPAMLSVACLYFVEKWITKISPKPIRVFFVPMVCFIIVVPVTLVILGPLGYNIGTLITTAILFLYDKLGWLAVGLTAAILPIMISMGMHKALVPYAVTSIAEMGQELLYMPASLAHNISEGGACLGVAVKTKDSELRSAAISAGISAVFGITEPALYSVTLMHKKVLYSVMISSFVSGTFVGLVGLKAFVAMGPGLAGMAMFVDPSNAMNIVWGFAGFGLALVLSFICAFILYKDGESTESNIVETSATEVVDGEVEIVAPVDGKCISLSEVKDEVFASGIMGKGVAFQWESDTLVSPVDGTITMVANTSHAIGFKCLNGTEVLIHVGLDTVNLDGKGFTALKKVGDCVKKGDAVLKVDRAFMKQQNIDMTTPMVVTNSAEHNVTILKESSVVEANSTIVMISE